MPAVIMPDVLMPAAIMPAAIMPAAIMPAVIMPAAIRNRSALHTVAPLYSLLRDNHTPVVPQPIK